MAIYGLNFNSTHIPDPIARKFRKQIKLPGMKRGENALLAGVATTLAERDQMLVQATNGSRKLHVVEKPTAGAPFYGIYVHHADDVPNDPLVGGALKRVVERAEQKAFDDDVEDLGGTVACMKHGDD